MSSHFDFNSNKCWSCEFFSGKRDYANGLFSNHVETDSCGVCNNKNSRHTGKKVSEDDYCSNYCKWALLQKILAEQEHKRKETNQIMEERRKAHEEWLASLSPEARLNYQCEQVAKKAAEKEATKKVLMTTLIVLLALVIVAIIAFVIIEIATYIEIQKIITDW